jgi:arabinosaccharide transport system substrate-binding protein
MSFHLGKPILILALLGGACGVTVLTRHSPPARDLTVWVFTDDEAQTIRQEPPDGVGSLIDRFQSRTGLSVGVDLIAQRALDARLISLFMSGDTPAAAPDLVEIDLASVGKYFRPPVSDIGLLPLNDLLSRSGYLAKIVPSRLTPWSKHGVIFGIPRDIHPVTLTFRKDLFDQAGVNLADAATWPEFQQKCLQFQRYWADHGYPRRMAMELFTTQSEELLLMLLQRHINIVDDENEIHLSEAKVVQTVAFYAQLVAGSRRIGADTIPGTPYGYRDLADGSVCGMITPDWRTGYLKEAAPELSGKVAMIPLPVFEPGDSPTSTWGGTMIGIPRRAKNPQASWQLLEQLCLSKEALEERHRYSQIIPPVMERWNDAVYQADDPFFGGQAIDQLYISLAPQIPARCMTPFSITAQSALTVVLNRAVAYAAEHGSDGLEAACANWLNEASMELRQWVAQGDFDQ